MTMEVTLPDHNYPVSESEAMVLMIHHLRLACTFFECTPDDKTKMRTLIVNSMHDPHIRAALAFYTAITEDYEALDREDDPVH